jgi:hypothetical protein
MARLQGIDDCDLAARIGLRELMSQISEEQKCTRGAKGSKQSVQESNLEVWAICKVRNINALRAARIPKDFETFPVRSKRLVLTKRITGSRVSKDVRHKRWNGNEFASRCCEELAMMPESHIDTTKPGVAPRAFLRERSRRVAN